MEVHKLFGVAITTVAALAAVIWAAVTYWPITLAIVLLAVLIVPDIRRRAEVQSQGDFMARTAAVEDETIAAYQEIDDICNHARVRMEHLERLRRLR